MGNIFLAAKELKVAPYLLGWVGEQMSSEQERVRRIKLTLLNAAAIKTTTFSINDLENKRLIKRPLKIAPHGPLA